MNFKKIRRFYDEVELGLCNSLFDVADCSRLFLKGTVNRTYADSKESFCIRFVQQ